MRSIYRIFRTGLQNFFRNIWLSSTTISIITFTLFIIGSLFFLNIATNSVLNALQEKIDVSVYFNLNTSEEQILRIKNELLQMPEIKNINYVSQEEALVKFREKHKDNNLINQSLEELDENPLEAILNIQAHEASMYGAIASFLEASKFKNLISKINYQENRDAIIARFASISSAVRRGGLILSLIFVFVSLLVVFNAIRLVIYSYRREIEIMRLVGARNWFIRGPFLVNGLLYGIFSAILCFGLLYLAIRIAGPKLVGFLPQTDLIWYFHAHILLISFLLLGTGIILGIFSSLIAIRRYLKI